jgi:membrane protein YqaA with SNARE-associated domain
VHDFFTSVFQFFLSPWGLVVLSALDSSMLFFLPAALDTAIIIMVARYRDWFWVFPLAATIGSLIGTGVTYAMGRKIGKAGLERWISRKKLTKLQKQLEKREVFSIGLAALLPPPFPLTPFVLTAGALGLDKKKFFISVGAMRFVRFGIEAVLALLYGRRILDWMKSDTFEYVVGGLVILALGGTVVTIYQVARKMR